MPSKKDENGDKDLGEISVLFFSCFIMTTALYVDFECQAKTFQPERQCLLLKLLMR